MPLRFFILCIIRSYLFFCHNPTTRGPVLIRSYFFKRHYFLLLGLFFFIPFLYEYFFPGIFSSYNSVWQNIYRVPNTPIQKRIDSFKKIEPVLILLVLLFYPSITNINIVIIISQRPFLESKEGTLTLRSNPPWSKKNFFSVKS